MSWGEFPGYPPGTRKAMISPEGTGTSKIMLIGEAPGEHEEREGLPFRPHAEAGSVLERALWRAGLDRSTLTIANMVWYKPPKNWLEGSPWEKEALAQSRPFLEDLIQTAKPKVIVALGGVAMRELTGLSGEKQGIGMTRGFLTDGQGLAVGIPVIGSYHPSFLRRGSKERSSEGSQGKVVAAGGGTQGGMALLGVMIRDLQLARTVAQKGRPRLWYDDYKLGATLEEWRQAYLYLKANPELLIMYDLETQDSLQADAEDEVEKTKLVREVTQVQISWRIGQALVSAWCPELLPVFKAILELPNPKGDWNGRSFDRPIIQEMGVSTANGVWHDLMNLFHHSQPDLPRGLQFATSFFCPEVGPWKHFSHSQPFLYGAYDVDMPQRIWTGLKTGLSLTRDVHSGETLWGDGKYSGYTGQVARLAPVLDGMTVRGIPVDEDRRSALDKEFTQTLLDQFAAMQTMVPDGVKGLHSYAKTPKDSTQTCHGCQGAKTVSGKGGKPKKCTECGGKGEVPVAPTLGAPTTIKIGSGEKARTVETTWTQTEEEVQVKCDCWWAQTIKQRVTHVLMGSEDCPKCLNTGKTRTVLTLWAKVEPFMPGSPQQVMGYLKWKMDQDLKDRTRKLEDRGRTPDAARAQALAQSAWYVPTDYKSGKDTTGEAELRRLAAKTGDALLPLVLDFREIQKLRGTYVEGWKPTGVEEWIDDDAPRDDEVIRRIGLVHPSFGFKPATAQLSSENPNAQNYLNRGRLAGVMKAMISAPPGRVLVNFDYKSFHVLTLGFEAQDPLYMRLARNDMHSFFALCGLLKAAEPEKILELSDEELNAKLKWYRKSDKPWGMYGGWTFEQIRNEKAKRCIAEDELVLTDRGLVEIQNVLLTDKVWDGVEWVHHDGVVYQGKREVITYEGLTATPDHEVFTTRGESLSLGEAASQMVGLLLTGLGREGVRTSYRDQLEDKAAARRKNQERKETLQAFMVSMSNLPPEKMDQLRQLIGWTYPGLPELYADLFPIPGYSGQEIRFPEGAMHESQRPSLDGLRRPRDQESISKQEGICVVCGKGTSTSDLQRGRDRPEGQQWELRTWESSSGFSGGTISQSSKHGESLVQQGTDSNNAMAQSLHDVLDRPIGEIRTDRRADNRASQNSRPAKSETLATDSGTPRKVRVYDILNAGPRACFTVSGKLVFNCILGVGFGQKGRSLYMLNPESYASIREAEEVLAMLDRLFPRPAQWRGEVQMLADKQHCLVSRHGFVRRFWDVLQRKPVQIDYQPRGSDKVYEGKDGRRWLLKPGDDAEACIAFLPANDAFGTIRQVMVRLEERGLNERFWLANTVHDSLVMCPEKKDLEECLWVVQEEMERPNTYLTDSKVAPEGLSCSVEAKFGPNLRDMEEYKYTEAKDDIRVVV